MRKKILITVVIILVVIQFIRPARNISATPSPHDISSVYTVPDSIKNIMAVACDDCHTNNTRYPWYSNIQPVGWWLQNHVNEGKRHLNYSEFTSYDKKKQYKKMDETAKEVKEGGMPLNSYLWIHKDAKLTQQEKDMIVHWAQQLSDKIIEENHLVREKETNEHEQ
jgi:hypothetical protein